MDDGSPDRSGFMLYTNAFTESEVNLLIKVLKINFDLNCSVHTRTVKKKAYMIYIKADS
jgi:LAGLIDADG DNA endonuclease family